MIEVGDTLIERGKEQWTGVVKKIIGKDVRIQWKSGLSFTYSRNTIENVIRGGVYILVKKNVEPFTDEEYKEFFI